MEFLKKHVKAYLFLNFSVICLWLEILESSKLKLKNFKIFVNCKIDFSSGTTIFYRFLQYSFLL